jgi:hypothetical protein
VFRDRLADCVRDRDRAAGRLVDEHVREAARRVRLAAVRRARAEDRQVPVSDVRPRRPTATSTSISSGNDTGARNSHDEARASPITSPAGSMPACRMSHVFTAVSMAT